MVAGADTGMYEVMRSSHSDELSRKVVA